MMIRLVSLGLGMLLSWTSASPLSAQFESDRLRVVSPSDWTMSGARGELVMSFGNAPDLIILPGSELTPDALLAATRLRKVLRSRPAVPGAAVARVPLMGFLVSDELDTEARHWAAEAIRAVRAAPISRVGNLGSGQWAEIEVPARFRPR